RKDWRFYAGMTAMALAVIMPLSALVVPVLGLSTTQSALLAGVLLAGGPEVLCILAVALLGKETFLYFAHRAKTALRRAVIDQPASKARYYTGLVVILLSWLPAYIYAYAPALTPQGDARIYLLAAMDLAFVVSVFLMGGEFWERSGASSSTKAGTSHAQIRMARSAAGWAKARHPVLKSGKITRAPLPTLRPRRSERIG